MHYGSSRDLNSLTLRIYRLFLHLQWGVTQLRYLHTDLFLVYLDLQLCLKSDMNPTAIPSETLEGGTIYRT